jgi:PAS domain S-box-containing protein
LLLCSVLASAWGGTAEPAPREVRNFHEWWQAANEPQPPLIALDVVADVTFFDPHWRNMWVLSGGGGSYLALGSRVPPLKVGQRIRLQGRFVPTTRLSSDDVVITILGDGGRIAPLETRGDVANLDRFQHLPVRLEGVVESQRQVDAAHVQLDVLSEGFYFETIVVTGPADAVPQLTGAKILVEGLYTPRYNERGELLPGAVLWTSGFASVRALDWLAQDYRLQLPLLPIAELNDAHVDRWIRTRGEIDAVTPCHSFVLKSDQQTILVSTAQRKLPLRGEPVELVARVQRTAGVLHLAEALVPKPILTGVRDVTELTHLRNLGQWWEVTAAGRRDRVQLDAEIQVTFIDVSYGNLWANNEGSGYYIHLGNRQLDAKPGDRFRIHGSVIAGDNISLENLEIERLEPAPLPEPLDARDRITELNQWRNLLVWIEGLVEAQEKLDEHHLHLTLLTEGLRVNVTILVQAHEPIPLLEGSLLAIEGVYVPENAPDGTLSSLGLQVSSLQKIREAAPLRESRLFKLPRTAINRLHLVASGDWVRIAGVVEDRVSAGTLLISQDQDQVLVHNLQRQHLDRDDPVEIVGRLVREGGHVLLKDTYLLVGDKPEGAIRLAPTFEQLRTAAQVVALPPSQAEQALAVRLSGTVVWAHPESRHFYLVDATRGVRVQLPEGTPAPTAGRGATLVGVTTVGPFASEVRAASVNSGSAMASLTMPDPRPSTLEQALTGADEAQWIELSGYVRSIERDGPWMRLQILSSSGEFRAWVPSSERWATLRGAIVRVQGVCTAIANTRRQLTGIELWVPNQDSVLVTEPAPIAPFSLPLQTLTGLQQFNILQNSSRLVRIEATVVHHVPGRLIYAVDEDQSIRIFAADVQRLEPGQRIEAVGLPGRNHSQLVLREAIYRRTGGRSEPDVLALNPQALLREELDGRLVVLPATVRGSMPRGSEVRLMMESGQMAFDALLPGTADIRQWPEGSEVRVRGVYELIRDENRVPRALQLQLRGPDDLIVLSRPPWLTPDRALGLSGGLVLLLLAGLGWVHGLRQRVHAQTREIRSQLAKVAHLETRQRSIIESASDCIFTADLAGRITSINPAGERITGYTPDEALQLHVRDLIAPDDQAQGLAMLDLQTGDDGSASFQCRFRRRDGATVWVETNARLLREDGVAVGLLGVVRDVTARRQHEEALTQARDAAEASARAKSTFLANMSHEIRTPMNGVIGMSNLLLDTQLDSQQHEFAETIRNSAEGLLTVLNDILDFSKIEAGKLHFESLEFSLNECVEGTLELMATRASAKRLELAAFVPNDAPEWVQGDPGRLRQVLLNLLGNAVKFTQEGEVVVRLAVEAQDDTEARIRFEIQDTGIGLTPEAESKLFQPFSQADSSTTRKFGGTGLGLAICRQIVELMEGEIGVRSQPGSGSTFWFTVPFRKAAPPNQPDPQEQIDTSHLLEGLRVAIVDDHETNRALLQHYVAAWGAQSEAFAHPPDALVAMRAAAAAGQPFTLALLDFQMPEMNGLMLARAIHEDPHLHGLKCLLLTSIDQRFPKEELHEAGILQMMTKPIRRNELRATIRSAVLHGALPAMKTLPARPQPEPAPPGQALRVLVAEDNVVNQRVARLQLEKLGHRVDLAANGLEVLEALERAPYDLILMDCQMPEMDGYEATRRIRQGTRQQDILVVAMTAHAMEGDREACLEAGMNDYLSKPVRLPGLQAVLENARPKLDERRAARRHGSSV